MKDLSREEFLRMARREDAVRNPIWNGPPRITTPQQFPTRPISQDGQLLDFLLPFPVNVFDDSPWPALHVRRTDLEILLLKPISHPVSPKEELGKGNETPDVFVTVFPAIVERQAACYPLHHNAAFEIVQLALRWMRILTRQYWIGTGSAGVSAKYRGSAFRMEGKAVYQRNFAHYGHSTIVRHLSPEIWEALIYPVEEGRPVPVPHSLFCDALTSFAAGDTVLCLVQLGSACEIAVTNLLDDCAAEAPNDATFKDYLKARHEQKDRFGSKLLSYPLAFGLSNPRQFKSKTATHWVDLALQLYKFRNKATHEGRAMVKEHGVLRALNIGELQSFIFATDHLLEWVSVERQSRLGSQDVSPLAYQQIVGIIGGINEGGGFVLDTSESQSQS